MFRYIVTFMIVNSYYQSLGIPITPDPLELSKSLIKLANQCENKVLSAQINNTLHSCQDTSQSTKYNKKQLQCLMFYDINTQLCSAVAESKIVIDDSITKIQEKQDVNKLCTETLNWVFTDLADYSNYHTQAEFVKLPASCGEICGLEETDIYEANYFCKYFKWGFQLLKGLQTTSVSSTNNNVVSSSEVNAKSAISNVHNASPDNAKILTPLKQSDSVIPKSTPSGLSAASAVSDSGDVRFDKASSKAIDQATPKQTLPAVKNNVEVGNSQDDPAITEKDKQQPSLSDQGKKSTVGEGNKGDNGSNVLPQPPGMKPKDEDKAPGSQGEDEYEEADGSDGNEETGIEDIDRETLPRQEIQQNINTAQQNILPSNSDVPKDGYSSMSDSFSDDGDHFIPFFLTAVILVVFLYVLYHNKSKVSKVFFGLILEGRQGGRRRNSRGHSYRRLDTLEQAMSANTAAPPSKIIY